ncbi:twin-arginine translocase subunit TatC, partial [bacterium]|nr:twin-arginine translocase subunit TatC [bacterium]
MKKEARRLPDTKPFVEHLSDLRYTLLKSICCVLIAMLGCFFFAPQLFAWLKKPLMIMLETDTITPESLLLTLNPTGAFIMAVKISFHVGLMIALPFVLAFFCLFLLPALKEHELKTLWPIVFSGSLLFVGGILFCYYTVLPASLHFLWAFAGWLNVQNAWTLEYYISFVLRFLLVFGIAFEMPLVLLMFIWLNILSPIQLKNARKGVILGIFILAAILTPPDIFTQIMLAIPLIMLYEATLWVSY